MRYWSNYRLKNQDNGVAAIEFAIVLPVMLLTLIGIFDVNDLIYCNNKINRTAQQISNIVTRGNLTGAQIHSILTDAAPRLAQPFDFVQFGNVIVTVVSKPSANASPQIIWQDSYPGTAGGSKINAASLPGGLVLNTKQTVVFTEVFFVYQPLVANYVISTNTNLYAMAASVPRQGTMTNLP